jgi:SAM-dependent methyltransferase
MVEEVELISPLQDHQFVETFFELSSEGHFWFSWRFRAFLEQIKELQIPLQSGMRVLDVGAGAGVLREQVEAATNWTVDNTDLDYKALQASKKGRGNTFYYDILEKRPDWHEKYDAILLFDVLEHIETTEGFIDAILFHLKKDGYLFLNAPAMPLLFSRYDEVQGHFRRYTMQTLETEFARPPVEILDMRFWGCLNVPLLLMRRVWLHYFSQNKTDEEIFRQGFAPPGKLVNAAFLNMMKLELSFPAQKQVGSSILLAARKLYVN